MSDYENTYNAPVGNVYQANKIYFNQPADEESRKNAILHLKRSIDREQIRNLVQEWAYQCRLPAPIKPLLLTLIGSEKDSAINLIKGIKSMLLEPMVEQHQGQHQQGLSVQERSAEWPAPEVPAEKRLHVLLKRIGKACFDLPCSHVDELAALLRQHPQHLVLRIHIRGADWDNQFASVFEQWLGLCQQLAALCEGQLLLVSHLIKLNSGSAPTPEMPMLRYITGQAALVDIPQEYELDEIDWHQHDLSFRRTLTPLQLADLKSWVETSLQRETSKLQLTVDQQQLLVSLDQFVRSEHLLMAEAEKVIEQCLQQSLISAR